MKFPGEKFKKNILLAPRCMCVTLYIDRCIALILCEISSPSAYVLYTVHSRVEWSNTFCDFWNRTQCYQSGIFQKFNVKHFWSLAMHARLARGTKALFFFFFKKSHISLKFTFFESSQISVFYLKKQPQKIKLK